MEIVSFLPSHELALEFFSVDESLLPGTVSISQNDDVRSIVAFKRLVKRYDLSDFLYFQYRNDGFCFLAVFLSFIFFTYSRHLSLLCLDT